jgi:hypothetical protein
MYFQGARMRGGEIFVANVQMMRLHCVFIWRGAIGLISHAIFFAAAVG